MLCPFSPCRWEASFTCRRSCRGSPTCPTTPARPDKLERDNPVLLHISKYRPYDKTRILRKEKGALYVHFPVGKAVINHGFRDNAPTLDRIVSITRDIMADTTSTVKCIQIIGLASVEGAVLPNSRLAGSRATALKRYIQQRVPTADALYECVNGGEAWTEPARPDSRHRLPMARRSARHNRQRDGS